MYDDNYAAMVSLDLSAAFFILNLLLTAKCSKALDHITCSLRKYKPYDATSFWFKKFFLFSLNYSLPHSTHHHFSIPFPAFLPSGLSTIYCSHETCFKQFLFIFRSTKDLIRQYGLRLSAATFLIIDPNEASIELACQWQSCMEGEVFLDDLDCSKFSWTNQKFSKNCYISYILLPILKLAVSECWTQDEINCK